MYFLYFWDRFLKVHVHKRTGPKRTLFTKDPVPNEQTKKKGMKNNGL